MANPSRKQNGPHNAAERKLVRQFLSLPGTERLELAKELLVLQIREARTPIDLRRVARELAEIETQVSA